MIISNHVLMQQRNQRPKLEVNQNNQLQFSAGKKNPHALPLRGFESE
jgi:hypothetical protein